MNSQRPLIKSKDDINKIREGGKILGSILHKTAALVAPGVSTWELNEFAEREIAKAGGRPAFKNYGDPSNPFPAGLCTSVNSEVVHGIPSRRVVLREGDIVGLDIGMEYKGRYTDTAITVAAGKIDSETQKLLDVTRKALGAAIKAAKTGNRIGDIAWATQKNVEDAGFNVIRDLVGHGVGYEVHEDPQVPCFGKPHTGLMLEAGMVLAIEPMVTAGSYRLQLEDDGWTISTRDGSPTAHFEHTIAVTRRGGEILT